MSSQLSLGIRLRDDATLSSFYPGNNQELLSCIGNITKNMGEPYMYLFGQIGAGKTHLLQGACIAAHNLGSTSFYLSLKDENFTPQALEGLESLDLVCIDDIDCIAGNLSIENFLLSIIDTLHANGVNIIVAGNNSINQINFVNKKLQERFSWGMSFKVQALQEEEKIYAVQLRAQARGIELPMNVGKYLVNHSSNMTELYSYLGSLDEASMMAKKKISLSFAKEIVLSVNQ